MVSPVSAFLQTFDNARAIALTIFVVIFIDVSAGGGK
jgi:hypothetical protein